jgi:hypothetical protein
MLHRAFALSSPMPTFCTLRPYIPPMEAHVEPQPEDQHRDPYNFSSAAILNDDQLYI